MRDSIHAETPLKRVGSIRYSLGDGRAIIPENKAGNRGAVAIAFSSKRRSTSSHTATLFLAQNQDRTAAGYLTRTNSYNKSKDIAYGGLSVSL